MAVNVIWKILIKWTIREIPIFVNPAENSVPKTSYESRLPSRLYEDPIFLLLHENNGLEGLYYSAIL